MDSNYTPLRSVLELRHALRTFAKEREWDQFHSPKNLAIALVVEAAELAEHFQWVTEEESRALSKEKLGAVGDEIADVLLYLVRLADTLNIDLLEAASRKLHMNARKYPPDKARGTSRKYTEL